MGAPGMTYELQTKPTASRKAKLALILLGSLIGAYAGFYWAIYNIVMGVR